MAEKKSAAPAELVSVVAIHSIIHGTDGATASPGDTLRVSASEAEWLIGQGAATPVLTPDEGL
jgi:hypothetical protein